MIDYQGRFVWYELITTDVAAARTFYTRVLGWGAQDVPTPGAAYTFFTVGNIPASGLLGLPEAARKAGRRPGWLGYVAVNDVDAAVDLIARLGGTVHVPPTDFFDVSRFAIVADPEMVPLALVKPLKPGAQELGEPSALGRVGWHELVTADNDAAFDFYSQLFHWRKADAAGAGRTGDEAPYHLFAAGGRTIGGMYAKQTVSDPIWLYYFNVRDIDAAAARVSAAGGRVVGGPVKAPGGNWIATCVDPQGIMFALDSQRDRPIGYFAPAARRPPNL